MNPRTRRLRRHRRNTRKFLHKIATKTAPPAVMEWWGQTREMKNLLETVMIERLRALKRFKGEVLDLRDEKQRRTAEVLFGRPFVEALTEKNPKPLEANAWSSKEKSRG